MDQLSFWFRNLKKPEVEKLGKSTERFAGQGSARVTHGHANTSQMFQLQKSGLESNKTPGLSVLQVFPEHCPAQAPALSGAIHPLLCDGAGKKERAMKSGKFCGVLHCSQPEAQPQGAQPHRKWKVLSFPIESQMLCWISHQLQWDSLHNWILQLPLPGVLCSSSSSLSVLGCLKI